MAWAGGQLGVAHHPQFPPQRLPAHCYGELIPQPLHEVEKPPAHHAVKIGFGYCFDGLGESNAMLLTEQRRLAGRFAIHEARRTMRIEAHHPVPHDLQAHTADPGCHRPAAAVVNRRQGEQAPGLCAVFADPRKPTQIVSRIIRTQLNRTPHGNLPRFQW